MSPYVQRCVQDVVPFSKSANMKKMKIQNCFFTNKLIFGSKEITECKRNENPQTICKPWEIFWKKENDFLMGNKLGPQLFMQNPGRKCLGQTQ